MTDDRHMTHSNITDLMAARRRYKEADTEIERRIARYNLRAAVYDIRASIERLRGLVARVGQTLPSVSRRVAPTRQIPLLKRSLATSGTSARIMRT